jgi:hypothetical protein
MASIDTLPAPTYHLVLCAPITTIFSSGSPERILSQALTVSASMAVAAALKFVMVPLVDLQYPRLRPSGMDH